LFQAKKIGAFVMFNIHFVTESRIWIYCISVFDSQY